MTLRKRKSKPPTIVSSSLGVFWGKGLGPTRREMLFSCIYLRTHVCIINMKTNQLFNIVFGFGDHTGIIYHGGKHNTSFYTSPTLWPGSLLEPSSRPGFPSVPGVEFEKERRRSQIPANQEAGRAPRSRCGPRYVACDEQKNIAVLAQK